jgi:hypothetical protein
MRSKRKSGRLLGLVALLVVGDVVFYAMSRNVIVLLPWTGVWIILAGLVITLPSFVSAVKKVVSKQP